MDQAVIQIVRSYLGEENTIRDIYRTHHLGKHKLDNNVLQPIIV